MRERYYHRHCSVNVFVVNVFQEDLSSRQCTHQGHKPMWSIPQEHMAHIPSTATHHNDRYLLADSSFIAHDVSLWYNAASRTYPTVYTS